MQPYFFPYLGYFDLINYADEWVVFDTPQYSRHGWINRNRVLHPNGGWQYVVVPVKKHQLETPISEIRISDHFDWKARIIGQIQHYKKKSPYFKIVTDLLQECFAIATRSIVELNVNCLEKTCEYLDISFLPRLYSNMVRHENVDSAGEWALMIARELGAQEYVNPPSGEHIFDKRAFGNAGIKLKIRQMPTMEYVCQGYVFEPSLSILDVMMWNSPEEIRAHLQHQPIV